MPVSSAPNPNLFAIVFAFPESRGPMIRLPNHTPREVRVSDQKENIDVFSFIYVQQR